MIRSLKTLNVDEERCGCWNLWKQNWTWSKEEVEHGVIPIRADCPSMTFNGLEWKEVIWCLSTISRQPMFFLHGWLERADKRVKQNEQDIEESSIWNYHHCVIWMWSAVSMHYIGVRLFQWICNRRLDCATFFLLFASSAVVACDSVSAPHICGWSPLWDHCRDSGVVHRFRLLFSSMPIILWSWYQISVQ